MIDPNKLSSLVAQHAASPSAQALGMAPPGPGTDGDMGDDDGDEDEDDATIDPAARGAELIASWGEFGETLKDSAEDLHDLAMDAGPGLLLKDVDPDSIKAVEKAVDRMPDELSMGIAKYVSALTPEELTALSTTLANGLGDSADQNLLNAFLTQAGIYAKDEIDVDEDFNVPEEDEEEETEEDPAAPPAAPPAAGAADPKAPPVG